MHARSISRIEWLSVRPHRSTPFRPPFKPLSRLPTLRSAPILRPIPTDRPFSQQQPQIFFPSLGFGRIRGLPTISGIGWEVG
ncbi:hypothetical protein MLD38_008299 [Melastoma candidum]|uniref:Uncharacterized protein n=1 Tax=Melastoma candidum TaxID=119954 RepID=A0ACB9RT09_9MYRT|nr:hypothetical protein MLD38_008299 [Melastoma candidum]